MLNFLADNIGMICSLAAMVLSIITAVLRKKGSSSVGVFDAIKWALKALPGLITFSETVNTGADGATKKAFVLEQITNNFAVMGVVVDESVIAEIAETIDKIVAATKRMHTDGKEVSTDEHSRYDVGTVTGLRA